MRRFYIPQTQTDVSGRTALITGSDANHIRIVLRMRSGDPVYLFDGSGFDYRAEIIDLSPNRIEVIIREKFQSKTESPIDIILAQALLKDRKLDDIIRQVTELGVKTVIPFVAHRSVSRLDAEKRDARRNRWEKIAKEALKQCGRSRIPDIRTVASFDAMLSEAESADVKILFWENETVPIIRTQACIQSPSPRTIAVVMGPEGGFTEEEVTQARFHGYRTSGMGPRILKADTATISACALLQYLFGDMGQINS
jgi:16S rRNA (uracil1498-N3)-methyltransferase